MQPAENEVDRVGRAGSLGASRRRYGFLDKYSDADKAAILWKSSLAMTLVGFVLALTGLILNRYDLNDVIETELKGLEVTIPSIAISSRGIVVGTDGCDIGWKVDPTNSPLHSRGGMTFAELKDGGNYDEAAVFFLDDNSRLIASTHLGDFSGFYVTATIARVLSIVGVALQGIALLWTLILRAGPSPFFLNRPLFGQTRRDHLIGATYHLILMGSAFALFASNTVMSTIMAPLLGRVANFALDWCTGSPFDAFPRESDNMDYMKFLGSYIQSNSDATGVTYVTFSVSISIIYLQVAIVCLLGILRVKAQSRVHYHLPRSQELLLPWYSKIMHLRTSVLLLITAVLATCTTAYSARVRGFDLNMFFYESSFADQSPGKSWSLDDILLNRIHRYVVDKSVVKYMLTLWIPLIMLVGFATVDYVKYVSKVIQTLSMLLIFSAVIGISTVPPTPAFVLQKPQCFTPPQTPPSFGQFFEISESCNDQIYSIYSILIGVPLMMVYFFIRYGSVRRKRLAYMGLVVLGIVSQLIVIATRLQYTVDVYIGCAVTVMYCLSQAPAFKLLLRFGIVQPGLRDKRPLVLCDKLNPALESVIRRLELHSITLDNTVEVPRDDIDLLRGELRHATEALAFAKERALDEIPGRGSSSSESSESDTSEAIEDDEDTFSSSSAFVNIDDTKKYN